MSTPLYFAAFVLLLTWHPLPALLCFILADISPRPKGPRHAG